METFKGHNRNRNFFEDIIKNGRLFHAYIFFGQEGIGKKIFAHWVAKKILCIGDKTDNCGCESCRMFEKDIHPDFKLVDEKFQAALLGEDVEEQKNIKIETIREIIRFSLMKPSCSFKKVIIIDNAHNMVAQAQNALLKTLEEPTDTTIFILITSNPNLLLKTVISRCHSIQFFPLDIGEVKEILIEKGYDEKTADDLSNLSKGSVLFAIKYHKLYDAIKMFSNYGPVMPFLLSEEILSGGNAKDDVLDLIEIINHRVYELILKGNHQTIEDGVNIIRRNMKYVSYLRHNVNPKLVLFIVLYTYILFKKGEVV